MLLVLLASFDSPKWHWRQNWVVEGALVPGYVVDVRVVRAVHEEEGRIVLAAAIVRDLGCCAGDV